MTGKGQPCTSDQSPDQLITQLDRTPAVQGGSIIPPYPATAGWKGSIRGREGGEDLREAKGGRGGSKGGTGREERV